MLGQTLGLVVESSPKPAIKIWDVKRESCLHDGGQNASTSSHLWAKAVLADFRNYSVLLCTRNSFLELWDLRRLASPLAVSGRDVGGSPRALRASFGIGSGLALSASPDGLLHLVNLDGSSGRLNIAKTLPGHREEVVSANVYWGDHAYPYVKAATISLQQDVLFWEVPWYKLKQEQISKEVSKERPKTRLEEVQDLQDIFWQPRCLPKGYQYRTRMVAYRSQAQYRERCALTGSLGGTIYSWEMHENNHNIMFEAGRFEGHTDQISTLSVDWKNGCALSGSCDATLRLWNLSTQHCERVLLGHCSSIRTAVVDWTVNRAITSAVGDAVRVWDLKSDCEPDLLNTQDCITESLAAFSTASAAFIDRSGTAEFWDLERQTCTTKFDGHPGTLYYLHFGISESEEILPGHPGLSEYSEAKMHRREETCEVDFKWPLAPTDVLASSCGEWWSRSTF